MVFDHVESRQALLEALVAELQRPLNWSRLTELFAAVDAALLRLDDGEIPLAAEARTIFLSQRPPPGPGQSRRRGGLHAIVLLLDACALGAMPALGVTAEALLAEPDGRLLMQELKSLLDDSGFARRWDEPALRRALAKAERTAPAILPFLLALAGMSSGADPALRKAIVEHFAVRILRGWLQAGALDAALALDTDIYEEHVKAIETPAHHEAAFAAIESAYEALTPTPAPAPPPSAARPRIAFLVFGGNILAHTEVLLSFLMGLSQLDDPPIEPFVLIYGKPQPLGARLDALAVAWQAMNYPLEMGQERRYRAAAEILRERQVAAAVFVSVTLHLPYLCRRPIAPLQIWWSMKFPLRSFEGLDGRVFYRSIFDRRVEIGGREWRGGPLATTAPPLPAAEAVEAIRARYPGQFILGTIAREQKVANAEYLEAIVQILRRHPQACFLWTGRQRLSTVQRVFDAAGVADRCHFIGWVDPAPYIAAFDVFIETYPLTGLMTLWSMAFGKPTISVGELGMLGAYLEPVMSGALPAEPADLARLKAVFAPIAADLPDIWARHPRDIVPFVDKLIADADLRRRLGEVQRTYYQTYLADEAKSAETQARHFADIVKERGQAASAARSAPTTSST